MDTQQKVLVMFFEYPHKEFHIRQLARATKLHPNTIMTITSKLARDGFIEKVKSHEKHLVIMKAKTDLLLYKLRKQAYNIEKIYKSGLIDFLNAELAHPTIMLFGSYAKAENHERSDIDIFVIADEKKELNVNKFEKVLNAEVQLFLHTKKEFSKLKKTNPELVNNVINGCRLAGYLEVV